MLCLSNYQSTFNNFAAVTSQQMPPHSERERLDDLLGLALLDPDVRERLIVERDPALLEAFDLSDDTRQWLANARVSTLQEFAQAIVAAATPHYARAEAAA